MHEHWQDKECEKVILFWLSKIANNKLLKRIELKKIEIGELEAYTYHIDSENSDGEVGERNYEPSYDKVKFDKIFHKLTPMAKEILLLCIEYGTLKDENTKHLPDDITAYLVDKYEVKSSAIRKAKERAIKAIKSCKIEK